MQHVRSSKDPATPGSAQGFQEQKKFRGEKKKKEKGIFNCENNCMWQMLLMSRMAVGQHGKAELTGNVSSSGSLGRVRLETAPRL